MFEYFANGGSVNGISVNNGWAIWGTLDQSDNYKYFDNDAMLTGVTGGVTLHRARVENTSLDWYSPGGKVNWFVGAAGAGVGNFADRFYVGTARSNSPVRF